VLDNVSDGSEQLPHTVFRVKNNPFHYCRSEQRASAQGMISPRCSASFDAPTHFKAPRLTRPHIARRHEKFPSIPRFSLLRIFASFSGALPKKGIKAGAFVPFGKTAPAM
jgi:hypothetical protein